MRLPLFLHIVPFLLHISITEPIAEPNPRPEALPEPEPNADAEAQTYTNNAPFSGAIYIVNTNGQGVTGHGTNMCPSYASVSCGDQSPSWCCPSGYTCAAPANSNGMIGCCPSGSSCGGPVVSVTTVTVYGAVVPATVVPVQPTTVVPTQPTQPVVGGFCQTLTMNGPGLPKVTDGACGTILIVSAGTQNVKAFGYGTGIVLTLVHLVIWRIFDGYE